METSERNYTRIVNIINRFYENDIQCWRNNLIYIHFKARWILCSNKWVEVLLKSKKSHGYPNGWVVLINHFKHKRDKNYYLVATIKLKYEIKLAEDNCSQFIRESAYHFKVKFCDHFFDFPIELKSQRVYHDDFTEGLAAVRTSDGVWQWYKTIEADLLPEVCGHNNIKRFSVKNIY